MSISAINATFELQLESSPLKFVLLCFANYANEYGDTYCSTERIQRMTNMNEKTIGKWVKQLEELGILVDAGKREGETNRIKRYKIVLSGTHPKSGVLEQPATPPKTEGLNTPKIGESPIPPYKDNLTKKTINKNNIKNAKMTLADWEAKTGAKLCVEMMKGWVKDQHLDEKEIPALITQFRDKVMAGGNQYADFVAAFRVWLREGYLKKTLVQIQVVTAVAVSAHAEKWDRGTSL